MFVPCDQVCHVLHVIERAAPLPTDRHQTVITATSVTFVGISDTLSLVLVAVGNQGAFDARLIVKIGLEPRRRRSR